MAQIDIKQVLPEVMERVRQCPPGTLIRNYVLAAREFCNHTKILTRAVTAVTIVDEAQYVIGNDTHEEVIGIKGMSFQNAQGKWQPVTNKGSDLWDPNAQTGEPDCYDYLPHAEFVLGPTPDAIYDLKLTVVVQPKLGVTSIEEALLVDWHQALIHGTLYHLLRIPDQPWTDAQESNNQYKLFTAGKNAGTSSVAANHNAGASSTDRFGGNNGNLRGSMLRI